VRVRDIVARGVTLVAAVPDVASACTLAKGVDAQQFLAEIDRPAYLSWAVSALSALIWYLLPERQARSTAVSLLLVGAALLQPAWWFTAGGDCGQTRNVLAVVVAAGSVGTLVLAVASWRRSPRLAVANGEPR
jgi:hypothetical protein